MIPPAQLRRADRIRKSAEFRHVATAGRRAVEAAFVVLVATDPRRDDATGPRLGITVSRKVGNAVVRNKLKRWIREWFRNTRGEIHPGVDLVVIARRRAAEISFQELGSTLGRLVERAGGLVK